MLAFAPLYSLGASPPVKQALVPYKFASVAVPEWTIGYYTWSWLAQKSSGSESANMGVQLYRWWRLPAQRPGFLELARHTTMTLIQRAAASAARQRRIST